MLFTLCFRLLWKRIILEAAGIASELKRIYIQVRPDTKLLVRPDTKLLVRPDNQLLVRPDNQLLTGRRYFILKFLSGSHLMKLIRENCDVTLVREYMTSHCILNKKRCPTDNLWLVDFPVGQADFIYHSISNGSFDY